MTTDENNKKGFGGFDDLVSDVSKDLGVKPAQPQASPKPPQTPPSTNIPPQPNTTSKPQSPPPSTSGGNSRSSSGWAWAIGIFILLVILANSGKKSEIAAPAAPYDSPAISNYSPSTESEPATEPAFSGEDKPPYGTNLVLSGNQIRYCLSEDIRLQAIKGRVNKYSEYEVSSFNSSISDYNNRCGQYQYRQGTLESVRGEVEGYRAVLEVDGMNRLNGWRALSQPDPIPQTYAPPAYEPPPSYSYELPEESNLEANMDTPEPY